MDLYRKRVEVLLDTTVVKQSARAGIEVWGNRMMEECERGEKELSGG
jgi:hypothetical protein